MNVKLISMTQPLVEVAGQRLTSEELIVYTARVSAPQNQEKLDTSEKLLKFLLKENHVSPFAMVDFTVEVETSRAIAAQILRHWSFDFQEFSQRYAEAHEYVEYTARRQDAKNRQNSVDDMSNADKAWFIQAQKDVWELAHGKYQEALDKGIAKEQARFLLPLNTKTRLYMKASVRDWAFYLKLRSGNGTQKEHMDIANAVIKQVFSVHFPTISTVFGWQS
jgi:thymidylate synthase (FAD)